MLGKRGERKRERERESTMLKNDKLTPYEAALCNGTSPPLSLALTFALLSNKYSATSR